MGGGVSVCHRDSVDPRLDSLIHVPVFPLCRLELIRCGVGVGVQYLLQPARGHSAPTHASDTAHMPLSHPQAEPGERMMRAGIAGSVFLQSPHPPPPPNQWDASV